MKRIVANYIYTPDTGFLRFGIVLIGNEGNIIEVIDANGQIQELHSMEFYSGLIVNCRISNEELMRYKECEHAKLEVVFKELFNKKPKEGLSLLTNVDFSSFSLKAQTTSRIIL